MLLADLTTVGPRFKQIKDLADAKTGNMIVDNAAQLKFENPLASWRVDELRGLSDEVLQNIAMLRLHIALTNATMDDLTRMKADAGAGFFIAQEISALQVVTNTAIQECSTLQSELKGVTSK